MLFEYVKKIFFGKDFSTLTFIFWRLAFAPEQIFFYNKLLKNIIAYVISVMQLKRERWVQEVMCE